MSTRRIFLKNSALAMVGFGAAPLWMQRAVCASDSARRKKILVERIALTVAPLLLGHRGCEAAALLGRVGELAEPVGQLHAADVKLEALGDPAVGGAARQRRLGQRIFRQQSRPADAEIGFDALADDAAEDIGPGVVAGDLDACGARG